MRNIHKIGKNIYITNDEEIKEGDFCLNEDGRGVVCEVNLIFENFDLLLNGAVRIKSLTFKKIILTTDQDLIKDGVQPIDDEFLEWFVKNPSCLYAIVDKEKGFYELFIPDITIENEIIAPKEEPLYDYGWCKCNVVLPKEETILKLPSLPYEYDPLINKNQETLEEAALKFSKKFLNNGDNSEFEAQAAYLGFVECAKWQKERSFTFKE